MAIRQNKRFVLRARRFHLDLSSKTFLMGIINVTPDSFSGDGFLKTKHDSSDIIKFAEDLICDGADIIEVGAESSRPGARPLSATEELKRILPVLKKLVKKIKKPISVDTYKLSTVQYALDEGASIINDIKGTALDKELLKKVRNYNAAIVLMHMKGTPRVMQKGISYKNLIAEIKASLRNSVEKCLEIGIKSDRIIIDPGIGFGKTLKDNFEILNRLSEFRILNLPILIGISRKSFIGTILNKNTNERLWGTLAAASAAILGGAHILRVHDMKAAKDAARITDAIINYRRLK